MVFTYVETVPTSYANYDETILCVSICTILYYTSISLVAFHGSRVFLIIPEVEPHQAIAKLGDGSGAVRSESEQKPTVRVSRFFGVSSRPRADDLSLAPGQDINTLP